MEEGWGTKTEPDLDAGNLNKP